jgi:hypothetical protein
MKRIIFLLCIFVFAITRLAFADESDDTLKFYLSRSDCVVSGTIVSEPLGISDYGVEYICDFKVSEVFKGDAMTNGITTQVVIARFEQDASDHCPLIKKGGECILFLKNDAPNIPKWRTADFWFGIQYPSRSMERSLKRLAQNP